MLNHDPTLIALASHGGDSYVLPMRVDPDVLNLSGGQIKERHQTTFIQLGAEDFHYGDPCGEIEVRSAYTSAMLADLCPLGPDNICLTAGAKHGLEIAIRAFVKPSSLVLIPKPGWLLYSILAEANVGECLYYDPNPDLIGDLCHMIESNPDATLILNYPNNPTGQALTPVALQHVLKTAARANIKVIADEVYRGLDEGCPSALQFASINDDRLIVLDSLSKWGAGAGLRVGFFMASEDLIGFAKQAIATSISGVSRISQKAALPILEDVAWFVETTRENVRHNLEYFVELLHGAGIPVVSHGGLYCWARCEPLIEINGVRVRGSDGRTFGAPGYARFCPASDPVAMARLTLAAQGGCHV